MATVQDSQTSDSMQILQPDRRLFGTLWGVKIGLYVIFVSAFLLTLYFSDDKGAVHTYCAFLLLPIAIEFAFSLQPVPEGHLGALYFYGRYIAKLDARLHILPLAFFTYIKKEKTDLETILEPGPRDEIFWGDEKDPLPEGMVRPIFMLTAPKKATGTDTATEAVKEAGSLEFQLSVGLGYMVLWKVVDVATFIKNVRNVAEATEQIRKMSEMALSELLGKCTGGDVVENQEEINTNLAARLNESTSAWGIIITKAGLTIINYSHDTAKALRDRAKASIERDTQILIAEGQSQSIVMLANANGTRARIEAAAPLIGRSEGLTVLARKLKGGKSEALAAITTVEALDGANLNIYGRDGVSQLTELASVFGSALANAGKQSGDAK